MKRILFLIAGLLALPLLADKPNVIVIMANDIGETNNLWLQNSGLVGAFEKELARQTKVAPRAH